MVRLDHSYFRSKSRTNAAILSELLSMSRISSVLSTFILTGPVDYVTATSHPLPPIAIVAGHHVQPRADRLQVFLATRCSMSKAADVGRVDHELLSQVNRIHDASEEGA